MNKELFNELSLVFKKNGFSLFLVGGAIRDFLLKKENKREHNKRMKNVPRRKNLRRGIFVYVVF